MTATRTFRSVASTDALAGIEIALVGNCGEFTDVKSAATVELTAERIA